MANYLIDKSLRTIVSKFAAVISRYINGDNKDRVCSKLDIFVCLQIFDGTWDRECGSGTIPIT